MKLSKSQRAKLFGMFGGCCAYCGRDLPEKGWHADHLEPIYREWWKKLPRTKAALVDGVFVNVQVQAEDSCTYPDRDVIENFMPSCRRCNLHKSAYSLESWRRVLSEQVRMARDYSKNFEMAERFGLVAQVQTKVVFYFERLSTATETEARTR